MIRSFADAETQAVFLTGSSRRRANIGRIAARKLQTVDFAASIEDLRSPPCNRLEKMKGKRDGQWSLRVNDQYRICVRWDGENAWEVEIVDYH